MSGRNSKEFNSERIRIINKALDDIVEYSNDLESCRDVGSVKLVKRKITSVTEVIRRLVAK